MTNISDERLAEMLAGLEKLPHGPWFHGAAEWDNGTAGLAQVDNGAEMWPVIAEWHEAAHIARCDPDTIRSILTELQSLRAQGGVRVPNADGWFALTGDARRGRCATEDCGGQPTFRLEASGVGSNYCSGCAERIKALSSLEASPAPVSERDWTSDVERDAVKAGEKAADEYTGGRIGVFLAGLTAYRAALAAKGGQ